jgi:4a-hydroxytetrahydrobiopterin dehydratase
VAELIEPGVVDEAIAGGPWNRVTDHLVRAVRLGNFVEAMALVNQVAAIAEEAGHHPDISISWATVTFDVTTHSAGGITQSDLDLSRRIDEVVPPGAIAVEPASG